MNDRLRNGPMEIRITAPLLGLLLAALFFLVASINLTAQGFYYDELHQATASFAYTGKAPPYPFGFTIKDIPVFNMPYSGAVKTCIYGLYMRLTGLPFTALSWRLTGIIFVCIGFAAFCTLVGKRGLLVAVITLVFLIADPTMVLVTRHDWGPTALALLLRLLFIGVWIRGYKSRELTRNSFLLGLIVGIAIFEKLSSLTLLVPFLIVISLRATRRNVFAALIGLTTGLLPLIIGNLYSWKTSGILVSLQDSSGVKDYSWHAFRDLFVNYLSLGNGRQVEDFILGTTGGPGAYEIVAFCAGLFITLLISLLRRQVHPFFQLSLATGASYIGIAVALHLLPRGTWVHHWVIGTPFQYASMALCIGGLYSSKPSSWRGAAVTIAVAALVPLFILRLFAVAHLERELLRGSCASRWDTSLSQMGSFAAGKPSNVLFVAADWGVATQVICLGQGREVPEPYWAYHGKEDLYNLMHPGKSSVVYLLFLNPPSGLQPGNSERIAKDAINLKGWRQVPVEREIAGLRSVGVIKIVRTDRRTLTEILYPRVTDRANAEQYNKPGWLHVRGHTSPLGLATQ